MDSDELARLWTAVDDAVAAAVTAESAADVDVVEDALVDARGRLRGKMVGRAYVPDEWQRLDQMITRGLVAVGQKRRGVISGSKW